MLFLEKIKFGRGLSTTQVHQCLVDLYTYTSLQVSEAMSYHYLIRKTSAESEHGHANAINAPNTTTAPPLPLLTGTSVVAGVQKGGCFPLSNSTGRRRYHWYV